MRSVRVCVWICLALSLPAGAAAQGRQTGAGDPDRARELERMVAVTSRSSPVTSDVLAGPVVTDAPFSADATTTVTQVLGDGTRIEQTTTARFYRDRAGRVRREQTILGLGGLNAGGNMQTITIAPDPTNGTAFTLDPMTRTARRVPRIAIPLAGNMVFRRNRPRARAHWRIADWRCGRQQPDRRDTGRASVRNREGPRPKDDQRRSDGADRERPADRSHRRAMGVARAENADLLA